MPPRAFSVIFPLLLCLGPFATAAGGQTPERRPLQVADLDRFRDVREPQLSPDGRWVAYTVVFADPKKDRDDADVWMSSWDGTEHVQLTASPDRESQPRWSPDGRYLAFLSARTQGDEDAPDDAQIWLMNRQGGEARRLTNRPGGVSDFQWSPDSSRIVFVGQDPDPEDTARDEGGKKPKTRKPIVIDRYRFKRDVEGYLEHRRSHLYLLTVETGAIEPLTSGDFDDRQPAWSPDGSRIAFTSRRGPDPDRTNDSNLFVIDARPGAEPRALTTWPGPDDEARPSWSPDGKRIAYLQGSEPRFYAYNRNVVAVVDAAGGPVRLLTSALDGDVDSPVWSADGRSISFVIIDDRSRHLARVPADGGAIERIITGDRVVRDPTQTADGRIAVLAATGSEPMQVHAVEGTALRRLSKQNDRWLQHVQLAAVEEVDYTARDGTKVGALLVRPPGSEKGQRLPLIVYIHGGPNSQDQHELDLESQLLAAHGYAVLLVSYRGSAGRDTAFQQAIFGDWGNKEVVDLLAGVDHLVAAGIADPERLGIGGWSYGGILTNYTIATDQRFKAAVSGAGSSLQTSMYGTDQYTFQYEAELGKPWKNPDAWMKVSYPFFKADRIRTPTLFLCGEKDFNVPIAGSEQMYQALRSEGVDTQLIVYPGQYHSLRIPSYRRDRMQRYLDWFDKYLKPAPVTSTGGGMQFER